MIHLAVMRLCVFSLAVLVLCFQVRGVGAADPGEPTLSQGEKKGEKGEKGEKGVQANKEAGASKGDTGKSSDKGASATPDNTRPPIKVPGSSVPFSVVQRQAKEAKKTLVLEFFAHWCEPCKEMEHEVFSKDKVQALLRQVHFVRYDTDTPVGKEAKGLLGVQGIPTLVALRTDGEVASQLLGARTVTETLRWLKNVAPDYEPLARLEERIAQNPNDAEAMLRLALRFTNTGFVDKARPFLEKATTAPHANVETRSMADWTLRKLKLRIFLPKQQLLERLLLFPNPQDPQTEEALVALLRLGPVDSASQPVVARVVGHMLVPGNTNKLNALVYRLLRAKAYAEAERVARYVLSLEPQNPLFLDSLAEVHNLRGQSQEALRLSNQAVEIGQKRKDIQLLADLHENRERFQRARQEPPSDFLVPSDEPQPWELD